MKYIKISVHLVLIASLGLNIYLVRHVIMWQESWFNQLNTTYEIERILIESNSNLKSFNEIYRIAKLRDTNVHIVSLKEESINYSGDDRALRFNDSLLVFENGEFAGTQSRILEGLQYGSWHYFLD